MTIKTKAQIKSSTQQFIEIEDIIDDVVLTLNNSCFIIVECGSVNYHLLSQEEQSAIIYSFSALLNSLSFPIQISIISNESNISQYLDYLKTIPQSSDNHKQKMDSYILYIQTLVKTKNTIEKKFYITIPFSPLEMGIDAVKTKLNKEYVITRAKTSLYPKRDHIVSLLQRIGLTGKVLQTIELLSLFYKIYNPSSQPITIETLDNITKPIFTTK